MQVPEVMGIKFPSINGTFVGFFVASIVFGYVVNKAAKTISSNTSGVVKTVADVAADATS